MPQFNEVVLLGHLAKEPELSYLTNQTAVCNFAIAVNDSWKNAEGTKQERVMFIDCSLFGKRGEALRKYLKKGDPVLICGKLVFEQWKSKSGDNRSKHKLQVREFSFVGGKKKGDDDANS